MSRRRTISTILIFVAIAVAGFIFGRAVLPRLILRNMEKKMESSESLWDPGQNPNQNPDQNQKPALVVASNGSATKPVDVTAALAEGKPEGKPDGAYEALEQDPSETQQDASQDTGHDAGFFSDPEDFLVYVDVTGQVVKITKDQEVLKEMIASTGMEGHETPLGIFEIQNRGTWFFSDKYKQGAKYWVSFRDWGLYLFHSVAMDENQQVIPEEEAKLGQRASHGCIRLKIEDAKWIYDNVPEKTKVVVHR